MPKVGKKHFDYTPEGMRKAREEARKSGKPMENTQKAKKKAPAKRK